MEGAISHGISILSQQHEMMTMNWSSLGFRQIMDVVFGHGVKLGREAQLIGDNYKCKWVQVVHTDPEELGMFKFYEKGISRGEVKLAHEVKLRQSADFVVAVGPKLTEAYRNAFAGVNRFRTFTSSLQVFFLISPEERKPRRLS